MRGNFSPLDGNFSAAEFKGHSQGWGRPFLPGRAGTGKKDGIGIKQKKKTDDKKKFSHGHAFFHSQSRHAGLPIMPIYFRAGLFVNDYP